MIDFKIPDMSCGHCASHITRALKQADPDSQLDIDLKTQRVQVQSAEDRQTLVDALTDAGYPPG